MAASSPQPPAPSAATANAAPQHDLTHSISPFLDRHMVFPLLDFLQSRQLYSRADLLHAKLALLSKTNMADFAAETYCELHLNGAKIKLAEVDATSLPNHDAVRATGDAAPKHVEALLRFKARKESVVADKKRLESEAAVALAVFDNGDLVQKLKQEKSYTPAYLQEHHSLTEADLDALRRYAKFLFDCGLYSDAAEYLGHYRALGANAENVLHAQWGQLAAEILAQKNWDNALDDLNRLRDALEQRSTATSVHHLEHRAWLCHWGLFVFFKHPNGRSALVDLFLSERYQSAIQILAPHLLRYLVVATVTNKKRRHALKDVVRVVQQEAYTYRDPFVQLIDALFVQVDFDAAQAELRVCDAVLTNDYFLAPLRDEFVESARLLMFEQYCRIHQRIDLSSMAQQLNMTPEAAERWVVNLMRNARMDAKIDSAHNQIVMSQQYPSVYQRVIEHTKGLAGRSYLLGNTVVQLQQQQMQQQQQLVQQQQQTA